jgi:predicted AAA+ superfamily ATPase
MIPRSAHADIVAALARQPGVVVLGPRQVGKTTLARAVAEARGGVYLDLEAAEDRAKLADPRTFFGLHADRLVVLDEVHRVPDLFETLRGVIDEGRRQGLRTGRFLLLGSAALTLARGVSETLAGRVAYIELSPLTVAEWRGAGGAWPSLWLRGGFPDALLAPTDADSLALRRDFLRSYLERDVAFFVPRAATEAVRRLWQMLAHSHAQVLNASDLARAAQLSPQTVTRYIDLLADLYLVRRLPPFWANTAKRLVKSPKVYLRDSGLLHALLGLGTAEALLGHPSVGASWEGFVIEQVAACLPPDEELFFYRTAAGAEADLVIRHADMSLTVVEVKRSLNAPPSRGLHAVIADLRPARVFVVHTGGGRAGLTISGPDDRLIEAVGLPELLSSLTAG